MSNEKDDAGVKHTSEPVKVEWEDGLGNNPTVIVDPYAGRIIVNGRAFGISTLDSKDVPVRMYREVEGDDER